MVQAAAAAKSLQSWPILCDPIDGSPPGSPVPGILQARTLVWVAISFSNAWKWKWKWSRSVLSNSSRPHGLQPTRLLHPWDFPGKSTGVGCHCLLHVVQECAFFLLFTAASSHLSLEDLSSPMWQKVDLPLTHSDSDWANCLQGVKLAGANKRAHSKYCRSRELSLKNTPYHPSNYILHKRELT